MNSQNLDLTGRYVATNQSLGSIVNVDMSGRTLRTLLDGRQLPAGTHYFDLPAADLKPGTYLLRATTARSVEVLRFVR